MPKSKLKTGVVDADVDDATVPVTTGADAIPVVPTIDVSAIQQKIARLLKFSTFEPEQRYWLDTGNADLNATLGSRQNGIPFGKVYELSGIEHGGKTLLGNVLMGMAQRDGAACGYIDVEDSRDPLWSEKLGVQWNNVVPVYSKLIQEGKDKSNLRLQSAEELFAESEAAMRIFYQQGFKKQFWLLDSIAMLQTSMVQEAGVLDQNMRTKLDRAQFLSSVLPRWSALAANYGATIMLINQLRSNPTPFANPETTPGGRALRHVCSIRATVKRLKNGQVKQNGKVIGIVGKVVNQKNKAGEGSVQGDAAGFKIKWNCSPAKIEFMSVEEAEAEIKAE